MGSYSDVQDGKRDFAGLRQWVALCQPVLEVEPDRIPDIAHDLFIRPALSVASLQLGTGGHVAQAIPLHHGCQLDPAPRGAIDSLLYLRTADPASLRGPGRRLSNRRTPVPYCVWAPADIELRMVSPEF